MGHGHRDVVGDAAYRRGGSASGHPRASGAAHRSGTDDWFQMSSARRSTLTALAVIDKYTRECLAIEVGRTGRDRGLFVVRGTARHLRSDHRPEFVAKAVRHWLDSELLDLSSQSLHWHYSAFSLLRDDPTSREKPPCYPAVPASITNWPGQKLNVPSGNTLTRIS